MTTEPGRVLVVDDNDAGRYVKRHISRVRSAISAASIALVSRRLCSARAMRRREIGAAVGLRQRHEFGLAKRLREALLNLAINARDA